RSLKRIKLSLAIPSAIHLISLLPLDSWHIEHREIAGLGKCLSRGCLTSAAMTTKQDRFAATQSQSNDIQNLRLWYIACGSQQLSKCGLSLGTDKRSGIHTRSIWIVGLHLLILPK